MFLLGGVFESPSAVGGHGSWTICGPVHDPQTGSAAWRVQQRVLYSISSVSGHPVGSRLGATSVYSMLA